MWIFFFEDENTIKKVNSRNLLLSSAIKFLLGLYLIMFRFSRLVWCVCNVMCVCVYIEQLFCDLLFTGDAALIAHTERALQHLICCFAEAAQLFGLEVSLKKTEVLHQPAPCRKVPPSSHHHRWNWAESSSSVHLPKGYHHIRCQDQQGSRQQTGKGKQHFWQTLQKSMKQ